MKSAHFWNIAVVLTLSLISLGASFGAWAEERRDGGDGRPGAQARNDNRDHERERDRDRNHGKPGPAACSVGAVIAFFDASVANGTLVGAGRGESARERLKALRNMLAAAEHALRGGNVQGARNQLLGAYERTVGVPPAPAFAAGPAAAELASRITALIRCIAGDRPPNAQVVNNTSGLLAKVFVGAVEFTENLAFCGSGCSTGFLDVAEGTNAIAVLPLNETLTRQIGTLGPFERNTSYAVNIARSGGSYCAGLWKRFQTASTFNDDTTRVLVSSVCETPPPSSSIFLESASGTPRLAEGTWTQCYRAGTHEAVTDRSESHLFAGNTLTVSTFDYASTDGSCSGQGTAVPQLSGSGTLTAAGTKVMSGWSDGATLTQAPPRLDVAGPLPAAPAATKLSFSGTFGGVSTTAHLSRFVDDTGPLWLLYRDHGDPAVPCAPDAEGYQSCLHALDFMIKPTHPGSVMLQSATGTPRSFDGVWSRCMREGGSNPVDRLETFSVFANTVVVTTVDYASSGSVATCTGAPTASAVETVTIAADGTRVVAGWSDGSALQPAPAAEGGGVLPATPTVTQVRGIETGGARSRFGVLFFVDDTAASWKVYGESPGPAIPCAPDAREYPSCLSTGGAHTKVGG